VFSLNRFTMKAAAEQLLPLAVASSAGYINHFFRGTMEIAPPDTGVYALVDHAADDSKVSDVAGGFTGFKKIKLKLKNTTPGDEAMTNGDLRAVLKFRRNLDYTDDLTGSPSAGDADQRRSDDEEIIVSDVVSESPGRTESEYTFSFSKGLPLNATDVYLQVVFKGKLGEEADAVAVATKNIAEPTFADFHNAADYILVGDKIYTEAEINADPALVDQIRPETCIVRGTPRRLDYRVTDCFDPTSHMEIELRFGDGLGPPQAALSVLPAKNFVRVAVLADVTPKLRFWTDAWFIAGEIRKPAQKSSIGVTLTPRYEKFCRSSSLRFI
jgi:hypothetical protein